MRHSLVGYSVELEDRYLRREKQAHFLSPMPKEAGGGADFLHIVSGFVESLRDGMASERDHHFGEVTDVRRRGRTLSVTMQAGWSGLESVITNPDLPEEPPFQRTRRHIERMTIRQFVVVPEESKKAYWFFETVGNRTLSAAYRDLFRRHFHARFKNLSPVFAALVMQEGWDAALEAEGAELHSVRVVSHRLGEDKAKAMGIGDLGGQYVETVTVNERDTSKVQKTLRQLREKYYARSGDSWKPRNVDTADVTATLLMEGVERTFSVEREEPVRMKLLVSDSDAAPSTDVIDSSARDWVVAIADRDDVALAGDWSVNDWVHDEAWDMAGPGRAGAESVAGGPNVEAEGVE